jgi:hypothetical protein
MLEFSNECHEINGVTLGKTVLEPISPSHRDLMFNQAHNVNSKQKEN